MCHRRKNTVGSTESGFTDTELKFTTPREICERKFYLFRACLMTLNIDRITMLLVFALFIVVSLIALSWIEINPNLHEQPLHVPLLETASIKLLGQKDLVPLLSEAIESNKDLIAKVKLSPFMGVAPDRLEKYLWFERDCGATLMHHHKYRQFSQAALTPIDKQLVFVANPSYVCTNMSNDDSIIKSFEATTLCSVRINPMKRCRSIKVYYTTSKAEQIKDKVIDDPLEALCFQFLCSLFWGNEC